MRPEIAMQLACAWNLAHEPVATVLPFAMLIISETVPLWGK